MDIVEKLIIVAIITILPFIELRGSIPYGIFDTREIVIPFVGITIEAGPALDPLVVFPVAVALNIAIIPALMKFLDWFFHIIERISIARYFIERTHKKAHPYIDKYGYIGLMLFVAVPLPGSGAYTGALAAHVFGMNNRKAMVYISLGVIIAGVVVTLGVTALRGVYGFLFGV